ESVEPSGPYLELVGCLMYLMTCTRPDFAYLLSIQARYVTPGRHRKEHMDAAKRVLRYLCSTSGMGLVLGGRALVVLTGHTDASWVDDLAIQRSSQGYTFSLGSGSVSWRSTHSSSELRWLTYLLTDLGEAPRSPPVLYVDNKAMLALCLEHRLEHRTKHIALRYFLAREMQQRGQLCLAYVATQANTADIFTKALQPCDHQRFCTMLGLLTLPFLTDLVTSCSPPLCLWGPVPAPTSSRPLGSAPAVAFDVWLDDLQLFLQCDSRDGLSMFDLTLGASSAPAADADSTVRSQWLTRDAAARIAVRSHLRPTEHAHFSQYKSARTLYDAVVARYSSPATAALSRLMLPYLFPDLAAFATVTDLITHLRTSDTRYCAALPAEDHFLSLCPTTLTVDLPEERLLAAETSITASALRLLLVRDVASARPSGVRELEEVVGAVVVAVGEEEGVGVGVVDEVGASVAAVELEAAVAVAGGVAEAEAAAAEVEPAEAELCSGDPSSSSALVRPLHPSSFVSGTRGARGQERVPLPSPPTSSLPALAEPALDSLRAASPTVMRLLATVVTDPSFESTAASALVTELVDFAAHCRLDFATSLVAESAFVCPPSVGDPDAPDIPTPRSYAEAIEGPYSSQWQVAMDAEMASWKSTGTYVDEVPPPGANIVSGMWIFRVKRPPGSPPVFKARYVARGFSQRQGVDYFQTFSPTPKMTTLRVLLHVAAQRDYDLQSLDFSTAFLQGSLHEEIWLRCPPGFTGSFPPGTQWSLRWPVYGLRQAPHEWHDTLRTTLAALGFAPSTADPSLFLHTDTLLPPFYILVYVDDLVFAMADIAGLAHVKSELQKRHTCTDLGELRSYLGLQITRDRARRTITLTQSHMVQQVLQRFDFTYSSPQATPLCTRHSLSALPSDESVEPSGPYPELVGCLMYLMTCTRPDLAYPLSILARYVASGRHRPEHMAAAKRVLRYLCSTSGLGLVLGGRSPVVLTGHVDAFWVDDLATQQSSQGYTFSLGSGSVSWRSTRLSSVLSSICEAEIYAGAMDAQELRCLTYSLTDLGEPPRSPPVLYVDNKAMLALCREHGLEHRTKHIALRYFLARKLQQRGQLRLAYVASQANTADIFTKALRPCDHQRFCTMLGLLALLCLTGLVPLVLPHCAYGGDRTGQTCGTLSHTQSCCFARLSDAYRTEFGDEAELPDWVELLGQRVDIFALDYDAILIAMYALPTSADCTCYLCVPPDPGIEPAALGAGEAAALGASASPALGAGEAAAPGAGESALFGTTPAEALYTFTLNSAAARCSSLLLVPSHRGSPADSPPGRVGPSPRPWTGPRAVLPAGRRRLHAGGEISSDLLAAFFAKQGIRQKSTLPASPQQNGVAERRIGLVMEVACTSMIHAAAPHFLWSFAVRVLVPLSAIPPRTSSPPALFPVFLGFVPDTPGWQFYHPTSRRVFPSEDVTFDESVPFYRVSQVDPPPLTVPVEVTGDSRPAEGGPARGAASGGAEPGGAEPGGAEPGDAEPGREESQGAEPGGTEPGGAAPGGAEASGEQSPWSGRLRSRSAGTSPLHSRRRLPLSPQQLREWYVGRQGRTAGARGPAARGAGAGDSATGVVSAGGSGAAEGAGARGCRASEGASTGGSGAAAGAGTEGSESAVARSPWSSRLRPRARGSATGGTSADVTGAGSGAGPRGARTGGTGAAGAGGAGSGGAAAGGAGPGGAGAEGSGAAGGAGTAGGAGAAGAGSTAQPRLFFAPPSPSSQPPSEYVLRQVLSLPSSIGLRLQPGSPLLAPSPYTEQTGGLTERCEPASRPISPVCSGSSSRRVPCSCQPAVLGTHLVVRRPSSPPQSVTLPSPPASSLPTVPESESDRARAAHPTVTRLLATIVTDPSFESTAASALVAELVDFAAACRPDYAASHVAASEYVCPPSVGGESTLGTDVLEDRQEDLECLAAAVPHLVSMLLAPEGDLDATDIPTPRSYAEAIEGPYSSQWQTAIDTEMASWKSTSTYVDEVPPRGANIVSGMWIFRVKRPRGSPPVFKARYVARGFSQREGVDFFHFFSPTPKMTTLRVLLHVAAQRDYELHSLDFSSAFLQGSLHEEIWLRRPPGFTGSFPPSTQCGLWRPVYGLHQAPREWHDALRTTLAALGFAPSTADPSLFLRTDTSLPPFYILMYVDDLVFATADTEALALVKSELQKRHTCTDLGELRSYLGLQITRDRARHTITLTQSHMVQQVLQRFGFTWSSAQATPLATGHSLSAPPSDEFVEPSGPYPELVGCLMYLMTCTRPDLAYPLGLLARYVAPGRHQKVHMDAAKRVLCYLCSTSGMGLVLGGRGDVVLTVHSDASWVDDQATQRSSSCEAEIYATAMAAEELRWPTYLLTDLGERPRSPPVLYVDNKAAIALC
ncbi:unnamed protein product, partial [Closterium sp. NIES-53]